MATQIEKSKLEISNGKYCDCPTNHINCLTAKEWILSQIGVWKFSYESRDIRDKDIHPATFPISLPKRCIELFTHAGELVIDPFFSPRETLKYQSGYYGVSNPESIIEEILKSVICTPK